MAIWVVRNREFQIETLDSFVLCRMHAWRNDGLNLPINSVRFGYSGFEACCVAFERSSKTPGLLTATNVAPKDDSEFFVYNNGDSTDFFEGDQFFGTMDKLGVNATVMNAYSTEMNDFNFYRHQKIRPRTVP